MPPSTTSQNPNEIPLESDSGDDFGPSAAPPAAPDSSSSSDSEDDYGPSLPSTAQKPTIGPSLPPSEDPTNETSASKPPARDDWMLAPPTNTGYQERDPTKLRARKFASKPSSSTTSSKPGEIASIWTETPEQKLERLRNSVLGRSEPSTAASSAPRRPSPPPSAPVEGASKRRKLGDKDVQEEEEGKKGRKRGFERRPGEEDDPSKRGFDREKDMAIGGALSGKQKNEFLSQAKNFGGRFTKGSSMR